MSKTRRKAWSFSALNNFETCPKKYWHLAIEKDYKEVEGEALLFGKRVHKALEDYVGKGKALPENLSYLAPYVQPFVDAQGVDKYCELQLAITKDFEPCDWKDWDNAWCRAMLDLAIVGDKRALLVDYKTGKIKDDGFTQLKLAAAMFLMRFKQVETVKVAYLWTENGGTITREEYSREEIRSIWNELIPRVNKFQRAFENTEYPARPSGLCRRHCVITSCPHHGG